MIGEDAPWQLLWASMYNAKCLTLPAYRHGRVLFAGDAAHLVPIFGVRGLNSGLEDAANLAWKLAAVLQERAGAPLLDTYSSERVQAARENIAYGAKSTEFMAPPDFAFRLLREATLRLALDEPAVRPLINPRQTTPIAYAGSALNGDGVGDWGAGGAPGEAAPEALLEGAQGSFHLTQAFGSDFTCLVFGDGPLPHAIAQLAQHGIAVLDIPPEADRRGQARERYGLVSADATGLVLVRPDGYVLGRWRGLDPAPLLACLQQKGVQP